MKRLAIFALILGAIATLAPAAFGELSPSDRQGYSNWVRDQQTQGRYLCRYYFKPDPNQRKFHYQYVVWDRRKPDAVLYYNPKGQYWCAASLLPQHKGKWNDFNETNLPKPTNYAGLVRINEFPNDPPKIPGSQDGAEMEFPEEALRQLKQLVGR